MDTTAIAERLSVIRDCVNALRELRRSTPEHLDPAGSRGLENREPPRVSIQPTGLTIRHTCHSEKRQRRGISR